MNNQTEADIDLIEVELLRLRAIEHAAAKINGFVWWNDFTKPVEIPANLLAALRLALGGDDGDARLAVMR